MSRNDGLQGKLRNGTMPCSIMEAVYRLGMMKASGLQKNASRNAAPAHSSSPIDVLAVVIHRSSLPSFNKLWICDSSLLPESQAAFLITMSSKGTPPPDNIQLGDVLRFNRIALAKSSSTDSKLYEFRYDWQDPEAGPAYCRLGHFDVSTGVFQKENSSKIPVTMNTDQTCLDQLVQWYRSVAQKRAVGTELASAPCQYRSLSQMQSSLGLVSHVLARVTHVSVDSNDNNLQRRAGFKRQRLARSSSSRHCWALLTDARQQQVLSFWDTSSRFQSVLKQASGTEQPVRFTKVMTTCQNDQVVLVPTRDSTVQLLTNNAEEWQHWLQLSATTTNNQGSNSNSCSQELSLSQMSPGPTATRRIEHEKPTSRREAVVVELVSPLIDIMVDSSRKISLVNHPVSTWKSLLATTTAGDAAKHRQAYRNDAMAQLQPQQQRENNSTVDPTTIVASLDGNILKILCGDLELQEEKWCPSLLQGLIQERIRLRWTLVVEDGDRMRVTGVTLIAFPIF